MNFNEQLITLRKQKGWSQEQLGEQLNVTRQTVSKWEMGSTTPEMDKLIELSNLFGISIDRLVGHERTTEQIPVFENTMRGCNYNCRYEYKSKIKFLGLPLVHINIGHGIYRAKGIIAIGTVATGFIALGAVSVGLLSFGALSVGVLALGGIVAGGIALGGFAVGLLAVGGFAIGMYSLGGCAIASHIAAGGYANAPIAIGDVTNSLTQFDINQTLNFSMIQDAILLKFPNTPKFIVNLFAFLGENSFQSRV